MGYSSVVIVPTDDMFEVVVTEDGAVTRSTFHFLEGAESFASGQRIRLGLPAQTQTDPSLDKIAAPGS
jgi:hypothetical protein